MFSHIVVILGQILFALISIPVFIINIPFEIYAHYFEDGRLKPVRYPFFLKEELDGYYHSLETIIKPYLNCEWACDILRSAEIHLKKATSVHKAFCKDPNHLANNQFYIDHVRTELSKQYCQDLFENSDCQRDWAVLFARNRLKVLAFQKWSDNQKTALTLIKTFESPLEERYNIIVEHNLCPKSFVTTFDIS